LSTSIKEWTPEGEGVLVYFFISRLILQGQSNDKIWMYEIFSCRYGTSTCHRAEKTEIYA